MLDVSRQFFLILGTPSNRFVWAIYSIVWGLYVHGHKCRESTEHQHTAAEAKHVTESGAGGWRVGVRLA